MLDQRVIYSRDGNSRVENKIVVGELNKKDHLSSDGVSDVHTRTRSRQSMTRVSGTPGIPRSTNQGTPNRKHRSKLISNVIMSKWQQENQAMMAQRNIGNHNFHPIDSGTYEVSNLNPELKMDVTSMGPQSVI